MRYKQQSARQLTMGILAAVVMLAAAACGNGGSSEGASGGSGAEVPDIAFDSAEANLPNSYPELTGDGDFTIGFLQPNGSQESLLAMQEAVEERVEELGGETVVLDAQASVDQQVSQFSSLLNADVDAIVGYPLDPKALSSAVKAASERGIPVIAVNTPWSADEKPYPGYASNIISAQDSGAYELVKAAAEQNPGASFAVLGTGIPVPSLNYFTERLEYWGKKFGLEFEGRTDAVGVDVDTATTAMNGILSKSPNVQIVFTYVDSAALAASAVARQQGKDIMIYGRGGDQDALDAVDAGRIAGTYKVGLDQAGEFGVDAAYLLLTGQVDKLPPAIATTGELVVSEQ